MSDQCKAIILGSLLGNGSLRKQKNYKNARFYIRHSQQDYFLWKAYALQEIASAVGYSKNKSLLFQSRAISQLTEIHQITYDKNKLKIQRRWLNHLTPLSLAIWWMDVGSLISNHRKGVLCTDGFEEQSVKLLAHYLKVVWKVNAHVGRRDRKYGNSSKQFYYRLWFSTEEVKKFLRIILPYIPLCMLKKVFLLYKDIDFQQRWISEIQMLNSNISENDIVQNKKDPGSPCRKR